MLTRPRTNALLAAAVAVMVVATGLVTSRVSAASRPAPRDPGVVRVHTGWLRGTVAVDHVGYSGIPYAAPPVGDRRWRPPGRPQSWSGVRDATTPGTPCPQLGMGGITGAEDCLYLDVKVPRRAPRGRPLPVLVWLHGGAFSVGSAREYNGTELATAGGMMVVTVNYRLGALGFLSSPEVDASGGNYGLMDQAAALSWVRRNAASFGGDPYNVTLAGQSAGARSVCAHLASPMSRGLFQRAISQSGACDNRVPTLAAARGFGARAVAEAGCAEAGDVGACMRSRTPAQLLGVLSNVGRDLTSRVEDRPWNPVAGTRVLPRQPRDALRDGSAARVPLLVGGTRDEMRSFVSDQAALTEQRYHELIGEAFGDQAARVLTEYPAANYDNPALALATALGDWGGWLGACPVLRTAETASTWQRVYAYEFAEDSGQVADGSPTYRMGSYHGLDLPYLWKLESSWNPYPELSPEQERLSATMVGYWSAFARTGNPNGLGRPRWPEFGPAGTVVELSTRGITPAPFAADHRCDLWAGLPQ